MGGRDEAEEEAAEAAGAAGGVVEVDPPEWYEVVQSIVSSATSPAPRGRGAALLRTRGTRLLVRARCGD